MDIQPLISAGLLPSDEKKKETVELAAAQTASILDRKQRELYVGNLPIGMVTQDVLMELFAPACTMQIMQIMKVYQECFFMATFF